MRLILAFAAVALVTAPAFANPAAKPTPAAKATPKAKATPAKVAVKPTAKPTPAATGTTIPAPNGKGCINSVTKKFAKCAAPAPAATTDSVKKDAAGKCHWASGPKKGKFAPQALCK